MRVGIGIGVEQTQKLVMTPELRQAIVILQLSSLELANYIEQALLDNPLLEIREEPEGEPEEALSSTAGEDWEDYFADDADLGYVDLARAEERRFNYEHYLTEAPTLHDHLRWQLQVARVSPRQRSIGEFLIGNIDDRGYLRIGIEEAARYLKVGPEEVRQALRLVQSFDPPGVGARDLTECLLLQLQQLDARNCLAEKVVRYYLADVAAGRLGRIARNLGVGIQEVQRLVDLIRSLDPKPGRRFGSPADVRYVQPDVIVEKVGDEYVVMVNDGLAPRLGISPLYSSLLRNGELCDPETRRFIEGKLNAATWLIRSIEQRRLTLYRVASCIVDFQREFLDKGIKYLKPLNLRRVAESLGIHESTVSRATANKYLQTPQGLFEFRFFFANNVSSNQQQEAAAQTVKKLLQEYIAAEDPHHPLTDQQLAELLRQRGICLARRTVAKYRDELGILAANKRKRY